MDSITKFNFDDSKEEILNYYLEQGYVVMRNVIDIPKIDRFLEEYNLIKKHPFFVYYSQSRQIGMRPKLNEYGYIQESMQNATRLAFFSSFCNSFKSCIYSEGVSKALSFISGSQSHVSWQNMFFDQSTGTVDHQDSWYLDTYPSGHLIGVWYALEDIQISSGSFFVIPGSHELGLIDRNEFPKHEDFVAEVINKTKEWNLTKKLMLLNKGDILLWHPYLIHGAFSCQDSSLSRKSFTSHFYPYGLKAKDTESKKLMSIYDHKHPKNTQNPRIYSAYRYDDYLYNLLVYGLSLKGKLLTREKKVSMRREDYNYS